MSRVFFFFKKKRREDERFREIKRWGEEDEMSK